MNVLWTEKPKVPNVEGVSGGSCQGSSADGRLALRLPGVLTLAKSPRGIPGAGARTASQAMGTTFSTADCGLLRSPLMQAPLIPPSAEAWRFRLVAPRSLGNGCAREDVGEGVAGKGVLTGVVARTGWAEARTDNCNAAALGEGSSSDKISSMHRGWTKLARFCNKLLQSL